MKATRIYSEAVENITDMSQDRVILDLSWNEFQQLKKVIDAAQWPNVYKYNKIAKNLEKRIYTSLSKAKVEWH